ncbi:flavin reductase family protein [Streptomyces boninensis]|uniref:flavin reductase family protein n=1 Tax=Streptomyces boninensis TaxID=2039455 RepID=UPI003B212999
MTDRPDIRPLMAGFPSGVSVLTTLRAGAEPTGMTCSSLASVALAPPTLVVCLRTASPTAQAALDSGRFALNLLHEDARATSDRFASGTADKFGGTDWRLPLNAAGPHLAADARAIADCTVVHTVPAGDHTAVFAEVRRVTVFPDAPGPLLYGLRQYARWSDAIAGPALEPTPAAAALPGGTRAGG